MDSEKKSAFRSGARDAIGIMLGYFAVSFTLGIAMRRAGLTVFEGFMMSVLNNASAGEYAGLTMIVSSSPLIETALMTLIVNARYMLMSASLSLKIKPEVKVYQRLIIGFDLTDELFGLANSRKVWLQPAYYYGAMCTVMPGWAVGTALGVLAGNVLSTRLLSALSVALYGMFLAVIIPGAKKDHILRGLIILSFVCSYILSVLPCSAGWSEGTRTIFLTLILAGTAAFLFPKEETV